MWIRAQNMCVFSNFLNCGRAPDPRSYEDDVWYDLVI